MEKVRKSEEWFQQAALFNGERALEFVCDQFQKYGLLPLGKEQRDIILSTLQASIRATQSDVAELALTGVDVTFAVLPKPAVDPDAPPSPL